MTADRATAFVGKVPEHYDRYLAPLLFDAYADDLVARLPVSEGMSVLEVACGTGIVTRRLVLRLPFGDGSFDAVVCQFGLMFFGDKAAAARETFRVLRPGGTYLLNVWDSLERNPVQRITHETMLKFFPTDPPTFYTVPMSYHDGAVLEALLRDAGFTAVRCEHVAKQGESPTAADAAVGLVEGNPVYGEIMRRRPEALAAIEAAIAASLAREFGDRPLRAPLRALVAAARRPRFP